MRTASEQTRAMPAVERERAPEREVELRWLPKDTGLVSFAFAKTAYRTDIRFTEAAVTSENWQELVEIMDTNTLERRADALLQASRQESERFLEILWKREQFRFIANHLEKLPLDAPSAKVLVKELLDHMRDARTFIDNLEKFMEVIGDASWLVRLLESLGDDYVLAEKLASFPKGTVDAHRLADRLLRDNPASLVMNLNNFPDGAVPFERLQRRLFTDKRTDLIVIHLEKFPEGTVDMEALLQDLVDHRQTQLIASNLEKFLDRGIEPERLLGLLDVGMFGSAILQQVKRFPNLDRVALAKSLLQEGRVDSIVGFLDIFPPGSVDVQELVLSLLRDDDAHLIQENFKRIVARTDDVRALVDDLMFGGQEWIVVSNLEVLPPGAVDVEELVRRLISIHDFDSIVTNLEKFPYGSVDISELVERLIQLGQSHLIARHISKFPNGSFEMTRLVDALIQEGRFEALNEILYELPREAITHDMRVALKIGFEDALAQHRFRLVLVWMLKEVDRSGAESVRGLLEESAARAELELLRRDGRWRNARDLEECMHLSGLTVVRVEDRQVTPSEVREELEGAQLVVTDAMLTFYLNSYMDGALKRLRSAPGWRYRLDSSALMSLDQLDRSAKKENRHLREWLKWYLIEAVSHELEHQFEQVEGEFVPPVDADAFYRGASQEDILNFFDASAGRFATGSWGPQFGGASWARIARAGYALWASRGGTEVLVDHIFDLEHNTGLIFDKSPERVKQESTKLRQLLDLKRHEDLKQMLPKLHGICSPEVIDKAYARLRILERLEKRVSADNKRLLRPAMLTSQ